MKHTDLAVHQELYTVMQLCRKNFIEFYYFPYNYPIEHNGESISELVILQDADRFPQMKKAFIRMAKNMRINLYEVTLGNRFIDDVEFGSLVV